MRTSLNTFHRNNIHRALLLSCALTVLPNLAYAQFGPMDLTATGSWNDHIGTGTTDLTITGWGGTLYLLPGSTIVNGGVTLSINDNAIPGGSDILLAVASTLQAYNVPVTLESGNTISLSGDATLDAQSYAFVLNGAIIDSAYVLTVKGAGPITFGATNALTGTLHVGDGVSTTTLIY